MLHSRCRGIPKQSPTKIPRILLVGCCTYWQSLQSSKTCSRVDLQASDPFHVKPVANDLKSLLALDRDSLIYKLRSQSPQRFDWAPYSYTQSCSLSTTPGSSTSDFAYHNFSTGKIPDSNKKLLGNKSAPISEGINGKTCLI